MIRNKSKHEEQENLHNEQNEIMNHQKEHHANVKQYKHRHKRDVFLINNSDDKPYTDMRSLKSKAKISPSNMQESSQNLGTPKTTSNKFDFKEALKSIHNKYFGDMEKICGLDFYSEGHEFKNAFLWKHLLKFTQSK